MTLFAPPKAPVLRPPNPFADFDARRRAEVPMVTLRFHRPRSSFSCCGPRTSYRAQVIEHAPRRLT